MRKGAVGKSWNAEKKTIFVFRPLDHFRRFLHSCRTMLMDFEHTPESLTDIMLELLRVDAYQEDIYIRPLAYKADEQVGVRLHNLTNALAAVALSSALGAPLEAVGEGLARFQTTKGRFSVRMYEGFTIVDDSYNANPASMESALETLCAVSGDADRILVGADHDAGE